MLRIFWRKIIINTFAKNNNNSNESGLRWIGFEKSELQKCYFIAVWKTASQQPLVISNLRIQLKIETLRDRCSLSLLHSALSFLLLLLRQNLEISLEIHVLVLSLKPWMVLSLSLSLWGGLLWGKEPIEMVCFVD